MPDPNRPLSEGKIAVLKRLKLARDDAEDIGQDAKQFAVRMLELVAAGATESDLLWLINARWTHHFYGVTPGGQSRRQFRAAADSPLRDNSCFVLSDLGRVYVEANGLDHQPATEPARGQDGRSPRERVRWDKMRHELSVDGKLAKRFLHKAKTQWPVLDQFEDDGWQGPIKIDTLADTERDTARCLRELIAELNTGLDTSLIHFRKDPGGNRITFDVP